ELCDRNRTPGKNAKTEREKKTKPKKSRFCYPERREGSATGGEMNGETMSLTHLSDDERGRQKLQTAPPLLLSRHIGEPRVELRLQIVQSLRFAVSHIRVAQNAHQFMKGRHLKIQRRADLTEPFHHRSRRAKQLQLDVAFIGPMLQKGKHSQPPAPDRAHFREIQRYDPSASLRHHRVPQLENSIAADDPAFALHHRQIIHLLIADGQHRKPPLTVKARIMPNRHRPYLSA